MYSISQSNRELRLACSYLKTYVGEKYPSGALTSVGGLFFLRFICPVFIFPEKLQLVEGKSPLLPALFFLSFSRSNKFPFPLPPDRHPLCHSKKKFGIDIQGTTESFQQYLFRCEGTFYDTAE